MDVSKKKILIVDDEAISAILLSKMLTVLGYEVCAMASNGIDSIAIAKKLRPEIIFMDVRLNGKMSGVEASQKILEEISTKIIYISGCDKDELYEKNKEKKEIHFLQKPISLEKLKNVINTSLN